MSLSFNISETKLACYKNLTADITVTSKVLIDNKCIIALSLSALRLRILRTKYFMSKWMQLSVIL